MDRPNPPGYTATASVPANGNEHVAANNDNPTNNSAGKGFTPLRWTMGPYAVSNDVYFGTSSNAVFTATRASSSVFKATGPRTVVFRVAGFIPLKRPCTVNSVNGYITIAGQTAPGDGICLGNYRAGFGSAKDVNMRYIRLRVGDFCRQAMDGIGNGNS